MNTEIHVPKHYLFCSRGYAISMDTGIGRENRIMLMMTRFPLVTISIATKLGIISLDCERMQSIESILREHLGSVPYLSLEGKKISFWKAHNLLCRYYMFSVFIVPNRDIPNLFMVIHICFVSPLMPP